MIAIIPIDNPSPIAFEDVFATGDRWEKINSCLDCPEDQRARCCGNCNWLVKGAICHWQEERLIDHSQKPFHCVVRPTPADMKSDCILEFRSVAGPMTGKIRRVKDKRGVFV